MSNTLGRIDFAAKRNTVTVEVPELGGSFKLRKLSIGQLKALRQGSEHDAINQLAYSIVDDNGQRIYTTDEDIANLQEMSLTIFHPLIDAMNVMHGTGEKAAEETVKNSEASPSADSVGA